MEKKEKMIIPIASDHAGFEAKEIVKRILDEMDITTIDYGTDSGESVDYPDFANMVSQTVNNREHPVGILLCGSGQGMCMTANKYPRIRASLVWNDEMARLSRQHNNSNILCLPGKYLNEEELRSIVSIWLNTEFEGGRHKTRVEKIKPVNPNSD
ncbi:ribose 5-phosphate isomerase B [Balneolales bacterium ANBcel1]|nr:ribose 5-phosphate isomerase B [Balneolales bacterium ANBcel1]